MGQWEAPVNTLGPKCWRICPGDLLTPSKIEHAPILSLSLSLSLSLAFSFSASVCLWYYTLTCVCVCVSLSYTQYSMNK